MLSRYSRLFVNAYEYVAGVMVSIRYGRFHPIVHRALFALLSPSGPYFSPTVEGVERLLSSWLALCEGNYQGLAKFLSGNMECYQPANRHKALNMLLLFSRILIREFTKATELTRPDMFVLYNDSGEEYSEQFTVEYESQSSLLKEHFPRRYFVRHMPSEGGHLRLQWRRRLNRILERVPITVLKGETLDAFYMEALDLISRALIDLADQESPWPYVSDPEWVRKKAKERFLENQPSFWESVIDLWFEALDEARMSPLPDNLMKIVGTTSTIGAETVPESQTPLADGMGKLVSLTPPLEGEGVPVAGQATTNQNEIKIDDDVDAGFAFL